VIRDKSLSEKAFEVRRRGLLKERNSHVKAALTWPYNSSALWTALSKIWYCCLMQQLLSLRCCCSISSGFYSDPFGESARWSTKTWIFGCFFQFESFNSFPENCLGFAWFPPQPRFGHSYSWGFTKVFVQELQVIHNMETVWSSSLQVDWSARSSWILHDGSVSTE